MSAIEGTFLHHTDTIYTLDTVLVCMVGVRWFNYIGNLLAAGVNEYYINERLSI